MAAILGSTRRLSGGIEYVLDRPMTARRQDGAVDLYRARAVRSDPVLLAIPAPDGATPCVPHGTTVSFTLPLAVDLA